MKNTLIAIAITFFCIGLMLTSAVKAAFFGLMVTGFGLIASTVAARGPALWTLRLASIRNKYQKAL